jgi:hypothetical protein
MIEAIESLNHRGIESFWDRRWPLAVGRSSLAESQGAWQLGRFPMIQ